MDLLILTGETSGDLLGAHVAEELLTLRPNLQIAAVTGPRLRALGIPSIASMESLQVMGFVDVFLALPRLFRQFRTIRDQILKTQPKVVVCIDYPGLHLRLQKSLRKQGYRGKLIQLVCPSVWAHGKQRIPQMAEQLDLLLTLFPFEKSCFAGTRLPVEYIGHPLASRILRNESNREHLLALFPGSRTASISRNLPLQVQTAERLLAADPTLSLAISVASPAHEPLLRSIAGHLPIQFVPAADTHPLMRRCRVALATSGTVTLELALHRVPTVVHFAITPLDLFIARKVVRVNLSHYCIVNILAGHTVFPELFGPQLTEESLFAWTSKLWFDKNARAECQSGCDQVIELLGSQCASKEAARHILQNAL